MTREFFEKAKFGDRFVTRSGQEALFLRLSENSEWKFADFYVKDWGLIRVNRENGKRLIGPDTDDIVGMMPSLPDNLDEAAEEQARSFGYQKEDYEYKELIETFNAGVEWMAEQGVSTIAISGEDGITEEGMKLIADYLESLPDKTEVVLQIRKK